MAEEDRDGGEKPDAQPGAGAAPPGGKTAAAEQADSQDKTKDKPDSGHNEDG